MFDQRLISVKHRLVLIAHIQKSKIRFLLFLFTWIAGAETKQFRRRCATSVAYKLVVVFVSETLQHRVIPQSLLVFWTIGFRGRILANGQLSGICRRICSLTHQSCVTVGNMKMGILFQFLFCLRAK